MGQVRRENLFIESRLVDVSGTCTVLVQGITHINEGRVDESEWNT